jgi:hypothetical protein
MPAVSSMPSARASGLALAVSALSTLLAGCVPEFADDVSQVEEFRVLAIRSEPAEVAPGGHVDLSVLWATPEGETVEDSEVTWALCSQRKELTEPGPVSPACLSDFGEEGSEIVSVLGTGPTAEATISSGVCRSFGPLSPPAEDGGGAGRPVDPDVTGGFYQPVLVGQEAATLGGVRLGCGTPWLPQDQLVVFNQGYRPNEHPAFASLTRESDDDSQELGDGDTLAVEVGEEVRLLVSWVGCPSQAECGDGLCTMGENSTICAEDCRTDPVGCTGAEFYLLADVETRTAVPRRELVSVAWFTTSGTFESSVTDDPEGEDSTENVWTAPEEAGSTALWIVLRDDRGGVSWRQLRVEVTES